MSDRPSKEYLERAFRHFSEICAESNSPLYAQLSGRVADDERLLALASHNTARQPPPNMLFGAVHYLMLGGEDHALRAFYPSLGGTRPPQDSWPAFHNFCLTHEKEISRLVAARRVQTNEVGRCGPLMLGLTHAARLFDDSCLAIIEVGASAGLNLLFDHYAYDFLPQELTTEGAGGAEDDRSGRTGVRAISVSPAIAAPSMRSPLIRTELRGEVDPRNYVPGSIPRVVHRVGIDIAPVDVTDEDALRWNEAMIWPDQMDRIRLLRAAAEVARSNPPRIAQGDAMDVTVALLAELPRDAVACIYHTHATYQMTRVWRERFEASLADAACEHIRAIAHLSIEWLDDDVGPEMRIVVHDPADSAEPQPLHLASCHHHGRWMEWRLK